MKRTLIIVYDTDSELHGLTVANPDKILPNGNIEVLNILIGDFADEIYNELMKGCTE